MRSADDDERQENVGEEAIMADFTHRFHIPNPGIAWID
jgi:hypothetical protein